MKRSWYQSNYETDKDHEDYYRDLVRAEEHDAALYAPETPRPGSRQDAIDRGFDPRDWIED